VITRAAALADPESGFLAHCYLLCVSSGSAIDRQSNNVSLFSLVEQINVPARVAPPRGALIPVEVHAYFQLSSSQLDREFEMRFVLCADTGLETPSEIFRHRGTARRFRVRTLGLPCPPVVGQYSLQVDFRMVGDDVRWQRQAAAWPISLYEIEARPKVTH
jgi:hypothetical protein